MTLHVARDDVKEPVVMMLMYICLRKSEKWLWEDEYKSRKELKKKKKNLLFLSNYEY